MQTVDEIRAALDEVGDWWHIADMDNDTVEDIDGLVTAIERKGGGEGQGEYTHIVIKIEHEGTVRHFKQVGCHVSHDGTYWDGPFTEVAPVQKTITVWE